VGMTFTVNAYSKSSRHREALLGYLAPRAGRLLDAACQL